MVDCMASYTHRHEPFIFVQSLLVGSNEEAPVLNPPRMETRLPFQIMADHVASVRQQLHLHIAGAQLP